LGQLPLPPAPLGSIARIVEQNQRVVFIWDAKSTDSGVLELAAVSGHKTLQMLKRYTHLRTEDLARKLG
jgi:hypothetical protein